VRVVRRRRDALGPQPRGGHALADQVVDDRLGALVGALLAGRLVAVGDVDRHLDQLDLGIAVERRRDRVQDLVGRRRQLGGAHERDRIEDLDRGIRGDDRLGLFLRRAGARGGEHDQADANEASHHAPTVPACA
jgi:hypothetical protein